MRCMFFRCKRELKDTVSLFDILGKMLVLTHETLDYLIYMYGTGNRFSVH